MIGAETRCYNCATILVEEPYGLFTLWIGTKENIR